MAKMTRAQFLKMIAQRKAQKKGSDTGSHFSRAAKGRDTATATQYKLKGRTRA